MPVYKVLIIGAGQIGAFYDTSDSTDVLTHAHAFSNHMGFKLLGFVDQDEKKASQAAGVWGGSSYGSLQEAFGSEPADVVCLAVPDNYHYQYLLELAAMNLKMVFAEKPLTKTMTEAQTIKDAYQKSPVSLGVNYLRRFVPEFIDLRERVRQGEFGDYITGTGYYGKGLIHNGSHMLDLLNYLLGNISGGSVISQEIDFFDDDPSVTAIVELSGGGRFVMQNVDCRFYSIFEMDLLFSRKRLRILESGFKIEEYDVADNQVFAGYRKLEPTVRYPTALGLALAHAAQNIYENLTRGEPLLCSGEDAYQVMKTCELFSKRESR